MPLPPALLKKLAKRGLVEKGSSDAKQPKRKTQENPAEEIIAEDYDDDVEEPFYDYEYQPKVKKPENFWSERLKRRIVVDSNSACHTGCPNKSNVWHRCSLHCINTFGDGIKEPSKSYTRRKCRLLRRYPLPNGWKEVYDSGFGVHYYWNAIDDTVSWLPPAHPDSNVAKSASTLRREMDVLQPDADDNDDGLPKPLMEGMDLELPIQNDFPPPRDPLPPRLPPPKKPKYRDLDKVINQKTERRQRQEKRDSAVLDPMDPASYSDIPRGKWSDGLDDGTKKAGVDSTVSGTAFQMRPYPAPGAVLAIAGKKTRGSDSDDSDSKSDKVDRDGDD